MVVVVIFGVVEEVVIFVVVGVVEVFEVVKVGFVGIVVKEVEIVEKEKDVLAIIVDVVMGNLVQLAFPVLQPLQLWNGSISCDSRKHF